MRFDRRVINLEPGHVDLSWDGDELEFAEFRKVGRAVAGSIAWHLHKVA